MDGLHRLVAQIVSHVFGRIEAAAAVIDHREGQIRPEKFVDRIEVLIRVLSVRVVLAQVHRRARQKAQRLIEAARIRSRLRRFAQMPLAEKHRVIAPGLQKLRHRDFAGRHRLLGERRHLTHKLGMKDGLVGALVVSRNQLHERDRSRRELEAEARRVAPGHDRCARRRAGRIAGIAVGESHALVRDRIDIRRGHRATGDAATVKRDIVVAEVVGKNEHDVGWALAGRSRGGRRTLLPLHRLIGLNRIADALEDAGSVVPVLREEIAADREHRGHRADYDFAGSADLHSVPLRDPLQPSQTTQNVATIVSIDFRSNRGGADIWKP